jgi:hypothetical protein
MQSSLVVVVTPFIFYDYTRLTYIKKVLVLACNKGCLLSLTIINGTWKQRQNGNWQQRQNGTWQQRQNGTWQRRQTPARLLPDPLDSVSVAPQCNVAWRWRGSRNPREQGTVYRLQGEGTQPPSLLLPPKQDSVMI